MSEPLTGADAFKIRLRQSLQLQCSAFPSARFSKHQNVYDLGDRAESVCFIESGQIKLLTFSRDGKECLLAIHTAGDTFGELCLASCTTRQETATAMEDTMLKRIPCSSFFLHLSRNSLVEAFVHYLAARVNDQQRVIANLVTLDSEHRLGETLLFLAQTLGQPEPRRTCIEHKITHEELSQMVGTTRPRVTAFLLKFRSLGLIELSPEHLLIVKEGKLSEYLGRQA